MKAITFCAVTLFFAACGQGMDQANEGALDGESPESTESPLVLTKTYYSADLSGDGLPEQIVRTVDNRFMVGAREWMRHGDHNVARNQARFIKLDRNSKTFDLVYQSEDNEFWVSLSTGTSFKTPIHWTSHGGTYREGQAQYADVTGDGLPDIILQGNDNSFYVTASPVTHLRSPIMWTKHGGSFGDGSRATYSDYDHDGKVDLIFTGVDRRVWLSKSTGTRFLPAVQIGGAPFGPIFASVSYFPHVTIPSDFDLKQLITTSKAMMFVWQRGYESVTTTVTLGDNPVSLGSKNVIAATFDPDQYIYAVVASDDGSAIVVCKKVTRLGGECFDIPVSGGTVSGGIHPSGGAPFTISGDARSGELRYDGNRLFIKR